MARLCGAAALVILMLGPAVACSDRPEIGLWRHDRPDTNQMSSLTIEAVCQAGRFAGLRMRARAKCAPRDCTWGWAPLRARPEDRGWRAVYTTFTAIRTVDIEVAGDAMSAIVENDFASENRTDTRETLNLFRVEK